MRKRSPDLKALVEATEDGRIDVWVDGNGIIQRNGKMSSHRAQFYGFIIASCRNLPPQVVHMATDSRRYGVMRHS